MMNQVTVALPAINEIKHLNYFLAMKWQIVSLNRYEP